MRRETRDRQGGVAALVEERARIAPSRLAYAGGRDGRRLGYGEVGRLVAEWWVRLRSAGLGRGRRVGLQAEDRWSSPARTSGCWPPASPWSPSTRACRRRTAAAIWTGWAPTC